MKCSLIFDGKTFTIIDSNGKKRADSFGMTIRLAQLACEKSLTTLDAAINKAMAEYVKKNLKIYVLELEAFIAEMSKPVAASSGAAATASTTGASATVKNATTEFVGQLDSVADSSATVASASATASGAAASPAITKATSIAEAEVNIFAFNAALEAFESAKKNRDRPISINYIRSGTKVSVIALAPVPIDDGADATFSGDVPKLLSPPVECNLLQQLRLTAEKPKEQWECLTVDNEKPCAGIIYKEQGQCSVCRAFQPKKPPADARYRGRNQPGIRHNAVIWRKWACVNCKISNHVYRRSCGGIGCFENYDENKYPYDENKNIRWQYRPSMAIEGGLGSYTVTDLCALSDGDDDANELGCPCCPGENHGKFAEAKCNFSTFYDLKEETQNYILLAAILSQFGKCQCVLNGASGDILLALPRAGRTATAYYLGHSETDGLRTRWERERVKKPPEQLAFCAKFPDLYGNPKDGVMNCHIIPLSACGCPTAVLRNDHFEKSKNNSHDRLYNVIPVNHMCPLCQTLDYFFTKCQSLRAHNQEWNNTDMQTFMESIKRPVKAGNGSAGASVTFDQTAASPASCAPAAVAPIGSSIRPQE